MGYAHCMKTEAIQKILNLLAAVIHDSISIYLFIGARDRKVIESSP